MKVKMFEVRDRCTYIAAIAVKVHYSNAAELYMLGRAGFSLADDRPAVLINFLNSPRIEYDPSKWDGARTYAEAHRYIEKHFDTLESGAVVDVPFILGETDEVVPSDRFWVAP